MGNSITFRFAMGADVDIRMLEAEFRAVHDEVAIGESAGFSYIRSGAKNAPAALPRQAERLPHGAEVLSFVAHEPQAARLLADELTGRGGLGGIHHIMHAGDTLVVEYIGDLFLLFDVIDAVGIPVRRRAVVPLEDASLISIARVLWRDEELDENRILEQAAQT